MEPSSRTRWVPLGPYTWITPALGISASSGIALGILANFLFHALRVVLGDYPSPASLGFDVVAVVASLVLAAAVIVCVQRLRFPRPYADFDSRRIRAGRRTIGFSEITWAQFGVDVVGKRRHRLVLLFGGQNGPRFIFTASRDAHGAMDEATRELVARIIEQASIDLPASSYDPTNRFARYNFPSSLDKATALKVVLEPESIIDELPIA